MDHSRDRLEENNIVNEVRTSFLEYSMSVIVSRALPDVRDGLKPVHRRILILNVWRSGYTPDKPHRKMCKILSEMFWEDTIHMEIHQYIWCNGKNGSRLFSYRYMLVDGHGNFG